MKVGWCKLQSALIFLRTLFELPPCTQQRWVGLYPPYSHKNHPTLLHQLLQVFLTLSIIYNHCAVHLHHFLSNDLPVFVELKICNVIIIWLQNSAVIIFSGIINYVGTFPYKKLTPVRRRYSCA